MYVGRKVRRMHRLSVAQGLEEALPLANPTAGAGGLPCWLSSKVDARVYGYPVGALHRMLRSRYWAARKAWAPAEAHKRPKRQTESTDECSVVGLCAGQALPRPKFFFVFGWGCLHEKPLVGEGVALGRIDTFFNTIAV